MSDSITDPPTPEQAEETERLAGELLRQGQATPVPGGASLWLVQRDAYRQEVKRLTAMLVRIEQVCALAGVGKSGQDAADSVRELSLEFGHQIGRGDTAEAEAKALRAKVSDLSLALAREAQRRQEAEGERDAVTRLLIVDSLAKGTGWFVQEDLPARLKGFYPTFESAVAAVRAAAGLGPKPEGGT